MLDQTLKDAADKVEGMRGLYLFGMDGITVAGTGGDDPLPLDEIVVSYTDLLKRAEIANADAEFKPPTELIMTCDSARLVVRAVTAEYGLVAVLQPDGNLGRARYELRKAGAAIREELA